MRSSALLSTERAGALLGVVSLAAIVVSSTGRAGFAGAAYLGAAGIASTLSLHQCACRRALVRRREAGPALWQTALKARVAVLLGWQLALVGLLGVWAAGAAHSPAVAALSYGAAAGGVLVGDRLVALADSADQAGGTIPPAPFGRPRSRRLMFWALAVYPTATLWVAAAVFFRADAANAGAAVAPRIAISVLAALSLASTGLVAQRYLGGSAAANSRLLYPAAAIILAGAAAMLAGADPWTWALSGVVVASAAIGGGRLLGAGAPT